MITSDSPALITAVRKAGFAPKDARITLHDLPINLDRRDCHDRRLFLGRVDDEPVVHLTTAPEIEKLHARARAFAQHYPELVPDRMELIEIPGHKVFACSYVVGISLGEALNSTDELYASGLKAIEYLRAVFEHAVKPSGVSELTEELEQLQTRVMAVPTLASADKAIIQDCIFPVIIRELNQGFASCRMAHGDLTADNIFITSDGRVRLIDFEFSELTHLHALEWVRFQQFSRLPARAHADLERLLPSPPLWARLLFWLNQLELEYTINHPEATVQTLSHRIEKIKAIIQEDPRRFGRPVFLGSHNDTMARALHTLESRCDSLEKELNMEKLARSAVERELRALDSLHASTLQELDLLKAQRTHDAEELLSLQTSLASAEHELRTLKSVHAVIEQELSTSRSERSLLEQELRTLFAEYQGATNAREIALDVIKSLETERDLWRDRYHRELAARRSIDRSWEWKLVLPLRDLRLFIARIFSRLKSD